MWIFGQASEFLIEFVNEHVRLRFAVFGDEVPDID